MKQVENSWLKITHYGHSISPRKFGYCDIQKQSEWQYFWTSYVYILLQDSMKENVSNGNLFKCLQPSVFGPLLFQGTLWRPLTTARRRNLVCARHSAYSLIPNDSGAAGCQKAIIKTYWYNVGKNKQQHRQTVDFILEWIKPQVTFGKN